MPGIELPKITSPEDSSLTKPALSLPEDWSDQDFREAFESLRISNKMFHHREHIRLAWIYSLHFPHEEALSRMVQGIQAFAKHHGAAAKYHHTITVAWMRLVWHAARQSPAAQDFKTFAAAHPHLLNSRLLGDYYSLGRLQSDAARHVWIEPDLRSLA
jgi:hypothetical protein